ncbi:MAG: ABC transporter ATP-binding protein [Candidatus Heteroscillospira sp.]|jgi:ABC-2 type transport system ATP-binding protein
MNALSIKGLSKSYPQFNLEGLDLVLPAGCIMGLVGENGAGKTTVLKSILNLIRPDAGEIKVFGQSVNAGAMDNIGVVLDEGCFPAGLNAKQIGELMGRCFARWNRERYEQLLDAMSLSRDKKFRELSRGMKMKLSLAVAMSHGAKLLILDEATSGLDVAARDELLDLLLDYIADGESSVLISSHIVTDLEKICDYICFIHRGRCIFTQEKDILLDAYRVVRCSRAEFETMPKENIIGSRHSSFGAELLMERDKAPAGMMAERAGIEDILVFFTKGDKQ